MHVYGMQIHAYGREFVQKYHWKKHFQFFQIFRFSGQFFSLQNPYSDYYKHLKKTIRTGPAILKWCAYQRTAFHFYLRRFLQLYHL